MAIPNKILSNKLQKVKFYSLNIKGLNVPEKRSKLLLMLKRSKADIILIQETHFKTNNLPTFKDKKFPQIFNATYPDSKTRGVSILISKYCPFKVLDAKTDNEGRFLFIKGSLYNIPVTIANIYAPNKLQAPFFVQTLEMLESFATGMLIVGGDFNLALNPLLDTSSGSSKISYKALRVIKKSLHKLSLHDAWRTLHPNSKDFTFYSAPHNTYSRLDYLLISQKGLDTLLDASVEPMVISDHNPITLSLTFKDKPAIPPSWKLDNSLLNDTGNVTLLDSKINHYFNENNSEDVHPLNIWLAHKCVLRGELISMAARRNKLRQNSINNLTDQINCLEKKHKQSLAIDTLSELLKLREELLLLLEKKIKRNLNFSRKVFYEFGNKSSKLLANTIDSKNLKKHNNIYSITDSTGNHITIQMI